MERGYIHALCDIRPDLGVAGVFRLKVAWAIPILGLWRPR